MEPNIIIFFSDQQRQDTLGCYGQKLNVTPNIDKLAKEGVMFEYAFTPQPVCGPARACLQTGLYATQTTAFTNARYLPSYYTTLADYFNFAGYETAYFGKWHLASDEPFTEDILKRDYSTSAIPESRRGRYKYWRAADVLECTSHGYDGYIFDNDMNRIDFTGYRTDCITDYALDYLNCYNKDAPFFMFISHIEPHQQNDHRKCEGPVGSDIKYRDYEIPKDLLGKNGNWDINYPNYLGACNSLDYNLGRVIDLLKAKKIYENTIIIYTSDHSCHFGTRNNDYKRTCHDNSIRIPLIIKGGPFCGGKVISNHIVSLLDIPPTILECAGIAIPDHYILDSRKHDDIISSKVTVSIDFTRRLPYFS